MEKSDNMPIWVYFAFSSIATRKGALLMIWSCVAFSISRIPWSMYIESESWGMKVFLIEDWSWFAIMLPMTVWYWISLKWVDNNTGWEIQSSHNSG